MNKDCAALGYSLSNEFYGAHKMPLNVLKRHIKNVNNFVLEFLNVLKLEKSLFTPGKNGWKPAATCKMCVTP
jgi:hypothetical protein